MRPLFLLLKSSNSRAIFGGPSGGQQESGAVAPQQTQQMQEAPCTSQMNAFAKYQRPASPLVSSLAFRLTTLFPLFPPSLFASLTRCRCMQTNNDNFQACSFYFDMMKQCKASAGQN